jgi:FlaA1/EpsC-like NDP-sugar epimerase
VNETRRQFIVSSLKTFDLTVLILTFVLSMILSASQSGSMSLVEIFSVKVKLWNFVIFAALLAIWHLIFAMFGLYESKRLATRWAESVDAVKAATAACVFLIAASRFFHLRIITLAFLAIFWTCSSALLVIGRLAGRYLLARFRKNGRNLHFILILGTNARAIEFARKIEAKGRHGRLS